MGMCDPDSTSISCSASRLRGDHGQMEVIKRKTRTHTQQKPAKTDPAPPPLAPSPSPSPSSSPSAALSALRAVPRRTDAWPSSGGTSPSPASGQVPSPWWVIDEEASALEGCRTTKRCIPRLHLPLEVDLLAMLTGGPHSPGHDFDSDFDSAVGADATSHEG